MIQVLITGGAGFIGSNIARELTEQEYTVKILDNLSTGNLNNISDIKNKIELIIGDVRDIKIVKKVMKDVDYVFHQAALPSVPRSIQDPITTNKINVNGTLNILIAAQDNNVKKVVYASSSSVYGNTPTLPKREDMEPCPLSPYAITKLIGEYYCKVFYDIYGLETVSLRYFNVFGPRQDPNSQYAAVIPKFITSMLKNESPTIFGDGEQSRDFTFVKDVVQANILACKAKNASGEVFNIAYGKKTSINELVDKINEILGTSIKAKHTDPRLGDVRHSLADISKAKRILGYKPKYDIEEGLKETIEYMRRKKDESKRK